MTPCNTNIYKSILVKLRKTVILGVITAFMSTNIVPSAYALGTTKALPWMPVPGVRVGLSPDFKPAHLVGMTIHPKNALEFDFLIDRGDQFVGDGDKQKEYTKLIKYFLASLTIPDQDQWVNLSPYEKDRIIKENFGTTEMGRDLLAQDYVLKQITSSLIYPEDQLGKKFWDKVYERAWKEYGTTNVPVNTFNKVWIIPDEAVVYESGNTAYVLKNHLKVMLEEDYLSLNKNIVGAGSSGPDRKGGETPPLRNEIGSKIIREIILPELEREVNEGQNFANLRQIYSGMILATWYKKALKESLLGKIYADQAKTQGVNQADPKTNEAIYQQYLKAFKKGVFNYIKEDVDKYSKESIPRKYFSGGLRQDYVHIVQYIKPGQQLPANIDPAILSEKNIDSAVISLHSNQESTKADMALSAKRTEKDHLQITQGKEEDLYYLAYDLKDSVIYLNGIRFDVKFFMTGEVKLFYQDKGLKIEKEILSGSAADIRVLQDGKRNGGNLAVKISNFGGQTLRFKNLDDNILDVDRGLVPDAIVRHYRYSGGWIELRDLLPKDITQNETIQLLIEEVKERSKTQNIVDLNYDLPENLAKTVYKRWLAKKDRKDKAMLTNLVGNKELEIPVSIGEKSYLSISPDSAEEHAYAFIKLTKSSYIVTWPDAISRISKENSSIKDPSGVEIIFKDGKVTLINAAEKQVKVAIIPPRTFVLESQEKQEISMQNSQEEITKAIHSKTLYFRINPAERDSKDTSEIIFSVTRNGGDYEISIIKNGRSIKVETIQENEDMVISGSSIRLYSLQGNIELENFSDEDWDIQWFQAEEGIRLFSKPVLEVKSESVSSKIDNPKTLPPTVRIKELMLKTVASYDPTGEYSDEVILFLEKVYDFLKTKTPPQQWDGDFLLNNLKTVVSLIVGSKEDISFIADDEDLESFIETWLDMNLSEASSKGISKDVLRLAIINSKKFGIPIRENMNEEEIEGVVNVRNEILEDALIFVDESFSSQKKLSDETGVSTNLNNYGRLTAKTVLKTGSFLTTEQPTVIDKFVFIVEDIENSQTQFEPLIFSIAQSMEEGEYKLSYSDGKFDIIKDHAPKELGNKIKISIVNGRITLTNISSKSLDIHLRSKFETYLVVNGHFKEPFRMLSSRYSPDHLILLRFLDKLKAQYSKKNLKESDLREIYVELKEFLLKEGKYPRQDNDVNFYSDFSDLIEYFLSEFNPQKDKNMQEATQVLHGAVIFNRHFAYRFNNALHPERKLTDKESIRIAKQEGLDEKDLNDAIVFLEYFLNLMNENHLNDTKTYKNLQSIDLPRLRAIQSYFNSLDTDAAMNSGLSNPRSLVGVIKDLRLKNYPALDVELAKFLNSLPKRVISAPTLGYEQISVLKKEGQYYQRIADEEGVQGKAVSALSSDEMMARMNELGVLNLNVKPRGLIAYAITAQDVPKTIKQWVVGTIRRPFVQAPSEKAFVFDLFIKLPNSVPSKMIGKDAFVHIAFTMTKEQVAELMRLLSMASPNALVDMFAISNNRLASFFEIYEQMIKPSFETADQNHKGFYGPFNVGTLNVAEMPSNEALLQAMYEDAAMNSQKLKEVTVAIGRDLATDSTTIYFPEEVQKIREGNFFTLNGKPFRVNFPKSTRPRLITLETGKKTILSYDSPVERNIDGVDVDILLPISIYEDRRLKIINHSPNRPLEIKYFIPVIEQDKTVPIAASPSDGKFPTEVILQKGKPPLTLLLSHAPHTMNFNGVSIVIHPVDINIVEVFVPAIGSEEKRYIVVEQNIPQEVGSANDKLYIELSLTKEGRLVIKNLHDNQLRVINIPDPVKTLLTKSEIIFNQLKSAVNIKRVALSWADAYFRTGHNATEDRNLFKQTIRALGTDEEVKRKIIGILQYMILERFLNDNRKELALKEVPIEQLIEEVTEHFKGGDQWMAQIDQRLKAYKKDSGKEGKSSGDSDAAMKSEIEPGKFALLVVEENDVIKIFGHDYVVEKVDKQKGTIVIQNLYSTNWERTISASNPNIFINEIGITMGLFEVININGALRLRIVNPEYSSESLPYEIYPLYNQVLPPNQGGNAYVGNQYDPAMSGITNIAIQPTPNSGKPGDFQGSLRQTVSLKDTSSEVKLPQIVERGTDSVEISDEAKTKGGIDLNSTNLNLQIKRDGQGVPLPLDLQDINKLMQIQGFVPEIIEIKPAAGLPIYSELQSYLKSSAIPR